MVQYYYVPGQFTALIRCGRYLKAMIYMIIFLNWMSCAFYMTACPPFLLCDHTLTTTTSSIGQHCIDGSWLTVSFPVNSTYSEFYTVSTYFAVVTFMTVGFGDYSAENFYEVSLPHAAVFIGQFYRTTTNRPIFTRT